MSKNAKLFSDAAHLSEMLDAEDISFKSLADLLETDEKFIDRFVKLYRKHRAQYEAKHDAQRAETEAEIQKWIGRIGAEGAVELEEAMRAVTGKPATPHHPEETKRARQLAEGLPIEELELSTHITRMLQRAQYYTIEELEGHTADDLLTIYQFGDKSLETVVQKLAERGRKLKDG